MSKEVEFLKTKGLIKGDCKHFIIDFPDDSEINLGELLEEYAAFQPSLAGQKLWMERSMSELPPPEEGMSAFSIDVPLIYNDGSIKLGYYHYEAKEWYWFDYTGEGIKVLESVKWLSMSSEALPLDKEGKYSREDMEAAVDTITGCFKAMRVLKSILKKEGLKLGEDKANEIMQDIENILQSLSNKQH